MMIIHVNRENLENVRGVIVANAKRFDWSQFVEDAGVKSKGEDLLKPKCGTSCCIAGFAAVMSCPPKTKLADFLEADESGWVDSDRYEVVADDYILDDKSNSFHDSERDELHYFLYYPWEFEDKYGNYIVSGEDLNEHDSEAILNEALARIDWLLTGKDIDEYVIASPSLVNDYYGDVG